MIAKPNAVPVYGTTAEILALTPNDFGVGTIMVSSDQRRAWLVRFDAGVGANYLEPIVVADGQPFTTPTNLTVYVATTGNDANDGLTPATAVATLNQALVIAGTTGYTLTCLISVGAGVFNMPVSPNTGTGADGTNIIIPMPKGGNARTALPPIIRGTMTTLAADTIAVVTPGTAPTFTTIQLTVGGYAVDQFKNQWVYPTSGTRVGSRLLIVSNTVDTLTLAGTYSAGILPIAGDTVAMKGNGTIFRWTSAVASPQNVNLYGVSAWIDAINFQVETPGANGGGFISHLDSLTLSQCTFNGQTVGGWTVTIGKTGGIISAGAVRVAFADETALVPSSQVGGCVFYPTTGSFALQGTTGGGLFSLVGSVIDHYTCNASPWFLSMVNCALTLSSIRCTRRGGVVTLTNTRSVSAPGAGITLAGITYRGAVLVATGGMVITSGCDISSAAAGVDGICVVEDGYAEILGVLTSALGANGGFGVNCRKRSRVQVDLPSTSVTMTGAAGEAQVGKNAAATTWVLILGGLAVNINDLAAAPGPTEICYVSQ